MEMILDKIRQERGAVASIHTAYMDYPLGVEAHFNFYQTIILSSSGVLPREIRELIAVEVSRINQCKYCIAHHSKALELASVDSLDDTILKYFQDFCRISSLEPQSLRSIKEKFPFAKVVGAWEQAVMVAAYFNMVNRLAHAAGIEVEENFYVSCH